MAESPIDLSRPSPPALIPIRRFKRTAPNRRDILKNISSQDSDAGTQVDSDPDIFPGQPSWACARSCDIQARLGVPALMGTTLEVSRKVLRVCVNNNSIPPSSAEPLTGSRIAAMLSEEMTASLNETSKWSWLANLSRSHSVPNVAQSPLEVCPRRKAMSEERVTGRSSEDGDDRPRKRRRCGDSLECTRDCVSPDEAWANQITRKSMTGRHVRSGTGAAPATLKGLRDKILSRRLSAAATNVR